MWHNFILSGVVEKLLSPLSQRPPAGLNDCLSTGSQKPSPVFLISTLVEPRKGWAGTWESDESATSTGAEVIAKVHATQIYFKGHLIGTTKWSFSPNRVNNSGKEH